MVSTITPLSIFCFVICLFELQSVNGEVIAYQGRKYQKRGVVDHSLIGTLHKPEEPRMDEPSMEDWMNMLMY